MSHYLPATAATKFQAEVHHAFTDGQNAVLRNTVRTKDVKGAKSTVFNIMGRGVAQERTNFQTPIPLMNVDHNPLTVTVSNWTASEMTDIFLDNQWMGNERMELAKTVAGAMHRREDQLIINALAAAAADAGSFPSANTIATTVGGAGTNFNLAKLQAIAKVFDANGVPESDRHIALHPNNLHAMLAQTQVSSADYANVKALVNGDLDSYYGFKFHKIGDRAEGGLPLAGGIRSVFAWQKQAVGLAMNMEPKTTVDWDATYGAHRTTGFLSAGAGVIDNLGVVHVQCTDAGNATA